jgi:hypothetical protein
MPQQVVAVTPYPQASILWLTPEDVRSLWRDAPTNDDALARLTASAIDACLAYLPDPVTVSNESVQQAQLLQMRNTWNSSRANPSTGDFGAEDYSLKVTPLDWQVRQLLRPRRAVPVVG